MPSTNARRYERLRTSNLHPYQKHYKRIFRFGHDDQAIWITLSKRGCMTPEESFYRIIEVTGAKKTGRGWIGKCPAHSDRNPSFSINMGRNGKPLVKCFSGCDQTDVIEALKDLEVWYSAKGGC